MCQKFHFSFPDPFPLPLPISLTIINWMNTTQMFFPPFILEYMSHEHGIVFLYLHLFLTRVVTICIFFIVAKCWVKHSLDMMVYCEKPMSDMCLCWLGKLETSTRRITLSDWIGCHWTGGGQHVGYPKYNISINRKGGMTTKFWVKLLSLCVALWLKKDATRRKIGSQVFSILESTLDHLMFIVVESTYCVDRWKTSWRFYMLSFEWLRRI